MSDANKKNVHTGGVLRDLWEMTKEAAASLLKMLAPVRQLTNHSSYSP